MLKYLQVFCILYLSNSIHTGTIDEHPQFGKYKLVLDANWRWVHFNGNYQNCYDGDWKCDNCDDCILEGIAKNKYDETYGIREKNNGIELQFVTKSNVGSRLYLLDNNKYVFPNLINSQISFNIDLSELPCSLNSAVYLVEMKSTNLDIYGVGYGDAQCPTDIKYFSDGRVNKYKEQMCANEIDLVEANMEAMAWTLHPCINNDCYKNGADANSYRQGFKDFYGPGKTIDTRQPFTVITQFIGDPLYEIKRFYKQNDKLIEHPGGSLTSESIAKWFKYYNEPNDFEKYGGFKSLTESLKRGMVLVFSIWDDPATKMKWLDSNDRGPCNNNNDPRLTHPNVKVRFSDIIIENLKTNPDIDNCKINFGDHCVISYDTDNDKYLLITNTKTNRVRKILLDD